MLRTLGLFLSEQERKLSRLACAPPSSMDGEDNVDFFNYEPNLFLQGFVVVSGWVGEWVGGWVSEWVSE